MRALQRHELALMKELKKRLPSTAECYFSFYRGVSWNESLKILGIKPRVHNQFSLDITLYTVTRSKVENEGKFEWRGSKLKEAIDQLDAWLRERRRVTVSQVKALPASPLPPTPTSKRLKAGQLTLPAMDESGVGTNMPQAATPADSSRSDERAAPAKAAPKPQ